MEIICATEHAAAPTPETLQSLKHARCCIKDFALNLHYCNQTQCTAGKQAENLFDSGDKNGKLLTMLTADTCMPTVVPCVQGGDGILRSLG